VTVGARRAELRKVLLDWFGSGRDEPAGGFEAFALEVLRYQAHGNATYGALLRNRGLDPDALDHWSRFSPVPVQGFRDAPPYVGDPDTAEAVFLTSGTTGGGGARGAHRVRELGLYHGALLPWARRNLAPGAPTGPDGTPELRVMALMPDPATRPESSLAHMAGVLHRAWDDGGGGFFADEEWRLQLGALAGALEDARRDDAPVLVLATAFSLVHWLEGRSGGNREARTANRLPDGSRVMETGGFKGRSRELRRGELYAAVSDATGLPRHRIVNEYGMTEMLSQFYEPVLADGGPSDPERRWLVGPPWVRTRVLDPVDLTPVDPGTPGLLCHLDLANLDSAALLLTEDLGMERDGGPGFRVLGRNPGAPPRGCSLSIEAWLEAAR
jgi:hypothetical protein